MTASTPTDNPLLFPTATGGLPAFDRIRAEHTDSAVDTVLAENRARLQALFAEADRAMTSDPWEALLDPLEDIEDRLARTWGPVTHLFGVTSTAAWRKAYNSSLPKITAYRLELAQNEALFRTYERLAAGPAYGTLSPSRQKVVRDALRDFKLSGVALPTQGKARFKEMALRLSELASKFEENVIDSVQAWSKHVTDEPLLSGMTEQGKAAARARAASKNLEGFRLTLDFPGYDAVISYADNRDLRRELYEAYGTRASDQGPLAGKFDNTALMDEILALRHEQARLLGMPSYAEMSLATKMAGSPDEIERFLLDLLARARPRAQAELAELKAFAKRLGGLDDLRPWDVPYYSEKLRQEKLGFSEDELRPYFPAARAISGMFALVEKLYGVAIEKTEGIPTWHSDVTTYALREADGTPIGVFYLDPYTREDKRGGAWMDECLGRRRTRSGVQHPAAYLTCNFAPPLSGQPALLTHDELLTLFHEFGHGLHHLLTRVDEASVSGIRGVAWDAIELPSQFMENWCYHGETLRGFARHFQTDEPLPSPLLEKVRAGRAFQAGLATLRQIEFALFDLRLHRNYDPAAGARVLETLNQVRGEVSVFPPPAWNRMPNSFTHVFAGGYAAGYYSYKWAEVLSADAFAAFEESHFAQETGRRFRDSVLAKGGSREAMDLFVDFRGRRPSIDALLRYTGLAA
ncbi:MAG TPA: M3 family metallopeptidase [Polyangiaceae bacterium]|nr:M3 family metallopeptidase [Polyangiaceae bacterium]